jgi:hypothetical protein
MSPRCVMDLTTDCMQHVGCDVCKKGEETVRLSAIHGAAIAEEGRMRDLEMQMLSHLWAKILSGRMKYQQDR